MFDFIVAAISMVGHQYKWAILDLLNAAIQFVMCLFFYYAVKRANQPTKNL